MTWHRMKQKEYPEPKYRCACQQDFPSKAAWYLHRESCQKHLEHYARVKGAPRR